MLTVTNGVVKGGSGTISYGDLLRASASADAADDRLGLVVHRHRPGDDEVAARLHDRRPGAPALDIERQGARHVDLGPGREAARAWCTPASSGRKPRRDLSPSAAPIAGHQIVRIHNLLAVVADDEWDAIRGAERAEDRPGRSGRACRTPETSWPLLKASTPVADRRVSPRSGNADAAIAAAPTKLAGDYHTPIETHGSIGPSCAVADVSNDQATVHSGTQGPHNLLAALAPVLQMPVDQHPGHQLRRLRLLRPQRRRPGVGRGRAALPGDRQAGARPVDARATSTAGTRRARPWCRS